MPRTRSLAWSELKIGIVSVTAIVLAVLFIFAVGGQAGFFWQQYELRTRFSDVQGLKAGAVIRVAGVEVGKVDDIQFSGSEVEVLLKVKKEMQSRITSESRASIGSLSLLGEPVIDISPASAGTPLEDGDVIPSVPPKAQLSDVAGSATQSLVQINEMLKDIRAGKGTIGKVFTDDDLYKEITQFVSSARVVAAGLRDGKGTLGQMISDPAAYNSLKAALDNLNEMTGRINRGEGNLGRLLQDDALAKSLTSASGNFDQISAKLNRGEGTFGKLLTEKELYDRFNSLAARVDRLAGDLEKGQGSAGQFLHDKQLYDNMNAAAGELRSLIGDIRKDPKKYLNVRVSIF
jgi:phospholipid/cholesterol/gamma-HCH transport system substrate-binding protein